MGILTVTRVNLGEKLRDKERRKAVLCTMQVNLAFSSPMGVTELNSCRDIS